MQLANHKVVELLHISETLHPYLGSHFAPSASCTRGFLHPHCEMIGVIIRSPVSHGWLIILSQPSYKNSLQASLPRWDRGIKRLWRCPPIHFLSLYRAARGKNFKKENKKQQRTDHVRTLAGHKFYLASAVIPFPVQHGNTFLPLPRWLQPTQNEAIFFKYLAVLMRRCCLVLKKTKKKNNSGNVWKKRALCTCCKHPCC